MSTIAGTYEGTVHLRKDKKTIPATLKVLINVETPTPTIIPPGPSIPSQDRIETDASIILIKVFQKLKEATEVSFGA